MCRCQASPPSPFFQQRRHHLLVCSAGWIRWWLLLCSVHLLFSFPTCTHFPVLLSQSQSGLFTHPTNQSQSCVPVLARSVWSKQSSVLQQFCCHCCYPLYPFCCIVQVILCCCTVLCSLVNYSIPSWTPWCFLPYYSTWLQDAVYLVHYVSSVCCRLMLYALNKVMYCTIVVFMNSVHRIVLNWIYTELSTIMTRVVRVKYKFTHRFMFLLQIKPLFFYDLTENSF